MMTKPAVDTPSEAQATLATDPQLTVTVTSKMMQDYREQAPATDPRALALGWSPEGEIEVLTVGSDKRVYVLHHDVASPSGWSSLPLDFQATTAIFSMDVDNAFDRLFAIGNPAGQSYQVAELVRQPGGGYTSRPFGLALGSYSLSVAPFGPTDVAAFAVAPNAVYFNEFVGGAFSTHRPFMVRQPGGAALQAVQIACLSHASNQWPHPPLVSRRNGVLRAHRGVRETPADPADPVFTHLPTGDASFYYLEIEDVALPALPGVAAFAVTPTIGAGFALFAVDGSQALHVLAGELDPTVPGLVRWAGAWTRLELTGAQRPSFTAIDALRLPNGRIQVMLREDASGNLWVTGCVAAGLAGWDEAVNLAIGGQQFTVNLNNLDEMVFVSASLSAGIVTWSRDASADWRPEPVNLVTGAPVKMLKTYRATVAVTDAFNASVTRLPVRVSASDDIPILINGKSYAIGPGHAAALATNDAGCVELTVEITNSLYSSVLIIEGDFLVGGRLELRTDSATQSFLKGVTPQQLLDGIDPLTGTQIMTGIHRTQEDADAVSKALERVCGLMDHLYVEREAPAGCPVRLAAQRGVRYVTAGTGSSPIRLDPAAIPTGAWSFGVRSGRPVFRELDAAEVAAIRERVRAEAAADPEGFLGIDWGSVWESVENAVSTVVEIVVDAASTFVSLVINGIERTLEFVADTVAQVFDLVFAVFDIVGTILGTVVGWLLKAIGFLFGWDNILAIRDRLRAAFLENATKLPTKMADPGTLKPYYHDLLQQLRTQINEWIGKLEQKPIGSESFHQLIGAIPSTTSYFTSGDNPFVEQASWLLDKVSSALAKIFGEYGLPGIPGMKEAIESFFDAARQAGEALISLTKGLWQNDLAGWITNLASFESGGLTSFLRGIATQVIAIVDFIEAALDAIVSMLHLAFVNAAAIVEWLDRELYIPFLSAFYSQVLESNLSLLDISCLMVAIPFSILGLDAAIMLPEAGSIKPGLVQMLALFAGINAIVEGWNVAFPESAGIPRILADVGQAAVAMSLILYTDENWAMLGKAMLTIAALDMFMRCGPPNPAIGAASGVVLMATMTAWVSLGSAILPTPVVVAGGLAYLSGCLSRMTAAVPAHMRLNPLVPIGYPLLQGALGGSIAGIYSAYGPEAPQPA